MAQSDSAFYPATAIKLKLIDLITTEVAVSVEEMITPSFSVEVTPGYIFSDYLNIYLKNEHGGHYLGLSPYQGREAHAWVFRFGLKYYFEFYHPAKGRASTYFEPLLILKREKYPVDSITTADYTYDAMIKEVAGGELLLGWQYIGVHHFTFDCYFGVGLRHISFQHFLDNNYSIPNQYEDVKQVLPSVHFGASVGYTF
ncbi:MAG TPA: hypothetical protein VE978_08185 [Chitinophagales bacterium]|nr:hypothetical protein [Chitinophagales bacterium]